MNLSVMSVFDKKARAFCTPFFVSHTDIAVRTFAQAVNEPKTNININPEDFALFYMGTFDDANGLFTLASMPTPVAEAINLKRPVELVNVIDREYNKVGHPITRGSDDV